ncbi:hypothetical protein SAMN05444955_11427 [Lihuaxuella thermophila]|uniref:Uncharacterized protein n=1 Tax=Lihuaxuella thermophila TaxID=1173111 RepID=A0A1H8HH25_9BACL|nr:hypothetical protein SAMN05444955_11427 [Lihuaxuella thermophila]
MKLYENKRMSLEENRILRYHPFVILLLLLERWGLIVSLEQCSERH